MSRSLGAMEEDVANTAREPDVSVIIPAWNAAATIEEAIHSALNQVGCHVEIVVVDDGSSDETPEILASMGSQIRWVRRTNGGPAGARNHGSAIARGQWVAFLDSDDLWQPDKLARQLSIAQAQDTTVVYTNARNFGENLAVDEIRLTQEQCLEGDVYMPLLLDNFVTLSGLMVRRDVFERIGRFDEQIVGTEDWDLLLRLAASEAFAVVRDPVTLYRWGHGSLSKQHDQMLKARLTTIRRALYSPRGMALPLRFRRNVWANMWKTAAWFAENASRRRAVSWYLKSLCCQPFQPDVVRSIVRAMVGHQLAE